MRFLLFLPPLLAVAACNPTPGPYSGGPGPRPAPYASYQAETIEYGRIVSVQPVTMRRSSDGDRVVGTVAGGLVGAVIGHQFGSGTGKDLMTGAGAITGAIVGGNIASQGGTYTSSAWTVRLRNGGTITVIQASNTFRVGDRVSVVRNGDQVYLR
ncbi:glycine zipper 2TM domain-containing protein [uncultured Thioclava sp.]|uniref:glycine zipper 2TM domain-containing protein n=1 Tax=uncultured Thioclava sp. TaxID=473858 RepID=UPI002600DADE|nr:glycine zipper 2TM domain-containing protein [uncultured Thioclava sp.]